MATETTCVRCGAKYPGEVERDLCGLCVMEGLGFIIRGFTRALVKTITEARERREPETLNPKQEPKNYVN